MSSYKNLLQEVKFSAETSRNRTKIDIDGCTLFEARKDITLRREEGKKPDGFESKYDLRKSLAWDSAFFTSSGVLDSEELIEILNFHDEDNGVSQSDCLGSSRIGDCIARRSLAWDAAFFTSAGVLNQEELSMVNKGYNKSETQTHTHMLPGIEEEFFKFVDSKSTLISDFSLSSLEHDLFDDMRASMQKSSTISNLVNSSCNLQSQATIQNHHSSKRVDPSKVQINPSQTISSNGVGKTAKEVASRCEESNSSSCRKLSKRFSLANPPSMAATKKASLGSNQNNVRKPASESRSQTNSRDSARYGCSQSASIVKSPNSLSRKKDLTASDSSFRTPSKSLTRTKNKLLDSTQPIHFPSSPNSSETSTSGNHASKNCSTRLRSTITRKTSFNSDASCQGSDTDNRSCDQPLVGYGSKKTRFAYQDADRISKESSPLPLSVSREAKPSGLRMPSPKIGFLDLVNSTRQSNPNGGLKFHSGMQSSSKAKSGLLHHNGTLNRSRNGNIQSPRTLTRKVGSQQAKNQTLKSIKPNSSVQCDGEKSCSSSLAPTWKPENGLREENGHAIGNQVLKRSCLDQNEDDSGHIVENQIQSEEKENLCSFENQIDVLSKQIEALDFEGDLVLGI